MLFLIGPLNFHVETVPKFDGRDISVSQFATACKRAFDCLLAGYTVETETSLTRLLLFSKFNEHAYAVLENLKITKVERLIDDTDLIQSIIDEESKLIGRLERSVERKIEEEGLDVFVRGLPSDYRTALRFELYTDFNSALICLLRIDKQIKDDAKRTTSPTFRSRVDKYKTY